MKKRFFILSLVLICLCAISFGTISVAHAEEVSEPPISTETIETEELTSEELKEKLAEAIAKINELSSGDNFFKEKVLPFLIGGGIETILGFLLFLRPYLKKSSLVKKLETYIQALQAEKDNLTTLLSSSDPKAIKKAVEALFGEKIDLLMAQYDKKYKDMLKDVVDMKTSVETFCAQFNSFIEAARLAWASKPEVAALLAENPTKTLVDATMQENLNLRAYIREVKGEEADKIIKSLEVV